MGHSQSDKARSRDRILGEAATQIRDAGLESVSVGRLMRSVDLTHGGFYGHFESRSELLAHALERALADGRAASLASVERGARRGFHARLRSFLSRSHRDSRRTGCAIAALASDVARADDRARAVMSRHIEGFVDDIARGLDGAGAVPGDPAHGARDDGDAVLVASAMIGALLLSRVITDPRRSDAVLRGVRERLARLADTGSMRPEEG
jgi:TetR/AcrR family transcriptional repressor of nem operon